MDWLNVRYAFQNKIADQVCMCNKSISRLQSVHGENKQKRRDTVIDVAKGIGILMVVSLHSGMPYLTGVDMPLFFLISGFFAPKTDRYDVGTALRRKSSGLLKLTFIYIVIFSALAPVLALIPGSGISVLSAFQWFNVQNLIIDPLFYQPFQPKLLPLWFVPTLWWAMVFWIITRGIYEDWMGYSTIKKIQILSLLAILFVAAVRSPSLEQSRYVGWLARALYAYVFLCLGFIVYKYKEDILYGRWKFVLYLLAALSLACKLIFWDRLPEIDIRTMYFGHIERYYTFFLSISGIALVFAVALLISRCGVIARVMCYLGEKSFHIMCLHMLGFFIFVELPFSVLGLNILHVPGPWSNIIFFTGGLFFSLVVIAIVDRVKAYMARD